MSNPTNQPTLTIKSGNPSPHTGYITTRATLFIPATGITLKATTTGWGYNRTATVLIDLMNQLSCPNDGLHHNTDFMKSQLLNWIAADNTSPTPRLPVIFKHITYSDGTIEILALLPTIPANYGSVTCYAHIGQHSECSYEFITCTRPNAHATSIRNATQAEYAPLLAELQGIYETQPDPYRLEVKSQLRHETLVKMWTETHK
jgi:hypothetical protein